MIRKLLLIGSAVIVVVTILIMTGGADKVTNQLRLQHLPTKHQALSQLQLPEHLKESAFGNTIAQKPIDINKVLARRATSDKGFLDVEKLKKITDQTPVVIPTDPHEVFKQLPYLTQKQKTDGRQFIQYNPYVIETKFPGDAFKISLPNYGLAEGVIDNVTVMAEGIRWEGSFVNMVGERSHFSISQTMKDNYIVATFDTPLGSMNMEAKNGFGWIVRQDADFYLPQNGTDAITDSGTDNNSHTH